MKLQSRKYSITQIRPKRSSNTTQILSLIQRLLEDPSWLKYCGINELRINFETSLKKEDYFLRISPASRQVLIINLVLRRGIHFDPIKSFWRYNFSSNTYYTWFRHNPKKLETCFSASHVTECYIKNTLFVYFTSQIITLFREK